MGVFQPASKPYMRTWPLGVILSFLQVAWKHNLHWPWHRHPSNAFFETVVDIVWHRAAMSYFLWNWKILSREGTMNHLIENGATQWQGIFYKGHRIGITTRNEILEYNLPARTKALLVGISSAFWTRIEFGSQWNTQADVLWWLWL